MKNRINSVITLYDLLEKIESFCPIKVVFNNIVLYNDIIDEGEEDLPLGPAFKNRFWHIKDSIVESTNIEIVEFHHAVVNVTGILLEDKNNEFYTDLRLEQQEQM